MYKIITLTETVDARDVFKYFYFMKYFTPNSCIESLTLAFSFGKVLATL